MVSELSGQINESKELNGEIKKIGAVTGEIYPTGNAGTIEINKVITGNPGTEAKVENEGTKSKAILNITIPKGDKGETGAEGKGIKSIVEYYQISTSNTMVPNTWETKVPALTNINKYLWKYIVIFYTDNSTSSTMPAVIGVYGDTGEKGEKGDEGDKGDKGETGNKGDNGISPIITTSKNGKVTTITITDAEGTHTATINDGKDGNGIGDMLTSVYDIDKDGIVDNAKKVNGHTIESNVPANAIFTDTTYSIATNSVDGLMSKNDKTKLDNLANYDDTSIKADIQTIKTNIDTNTKNIDKKANTTDVYNKTETDEKMNAKQDKLIAGTNITIANNTISAKDTTYSTATSSTDGLMSKNDKSKLDGLSNYNDTTIKNEISTLKTSKQDKLIAGTNITISNNTISATSTTSTTYSTATSSSDGLMSKSDKSKLDNIFKSIYPVGSVYISVNSTNPSNLFGGTWTQIKDRFLLACGSTYKAGATGGEATHILTIDEMPSHNHTWGWKKSAASGNNTWNSAGSDKTGTSSDIIGNTGGGKPHNNMPPYLAVYMWKRTA